jgi:hypothetical protein
MFLNSAIYPLRHAYWASALEDFDSMSIELM